MDTKYQGWTNYETWATHLWLTNSGEGIYNDAMDIVKNNKDGVAMELSLKSYTNDLINEALDNTASLAADLLGAAEERINWIEIIEALQDI